MHSWSLRASGGARIVVAMTTPAARTLPLDAVSTWIAGLAALAFLGIGLRAVLAPAGAAAFFGLPVPAAEGLPFVQVFGARNVGLSLLALTLLVLDVRLGVAAVFLAAALIAGLDAWIVTTHAGVARALKHLAYVAGLAGFGLFLARGR